MGKILSIIIHLRLNNVQQSMGKPGTQAQLITSESLKDLMCLGTTWYQLESCRGHGSCLTLYYDCKTC